MVLNQGYGEKSLFSFHFSPQQHHNLARALPFLTRLAAPLFVEGQGAQVKVLYEHTVVSCVCAVSITGRPETVPPGRWFHLYTVSVSHRFAAPCVNAVDFARLEAPATDCCTGLPGTHTPTCLTGPRGAVPSKGRSPSVLTVRVGAVVGTSSVVVVHPGGMAHARSRTLVSWVNGMLNTWTNGTRFSP